MKILIIYTLLIIFKKYVLTLDKLIGIYDKNLHITLKKEKKKKKEMKQCLLY